MSRHRGAPVRPRYGRLAALGSSLAVTAIAVLGGAGVLPSAVGDLDEPGRSGGGAAAIEGVAADEPAAAPSTSPPATVDEGSADSDAAATDPVDDAVLPADSGRGRRIVFSQSRQRVWLVDRGQHVERTYLVSGSVSDNLDPGTYSVYSRSEQAWGIDDSGTMRYFVRFTQGDTGAAIGFHDIPIDGGEPVQTLAQLGTPQSHGCVRQKRSDAVALWEFAPLGTTVVVTA
ncbi:L,D-transpeptidase [Nocardioides sp.]|uniref:L,D-transpeptidase n=1 Tax=Nocardioides sp. TaxID=35761 RepID=UPI002ED78E30